MSFVNFRLVGGALAAALIKLPLLVFAAAAVAGAVRLATLRRLGRRSAPGLY